MERRDEVRRDEREREIGRERNMMITRLGSREETLRAKGGERERQGETDGRTGGRTGTVTAAAVTAAAVTAGITATGG
jgi:hypothetical protein